uniref:Uncharacterized protein n=1 Tax=Pinguiococcus pyrenoidosus TaxID=172671 RepID=A0A7R9YDH2_9STRA|mmetsp:Transcript_4657/g.18585  ORF Transcript_4657/g.18585 Transcript_4657/m.18585 type:complete len:486 (+) Transcript_4657:2280-3737(+)
MRCTVLIKHVGREWYNETTFQDRVSVDSDAAAAVAEKYIMAGPRRGRFQQQRQQQQAASQSKVAPDYGHPHFTSDYEGLIAEVVAEGRHKEASRLFRGLLRVADIQRSSAKMIEVLRSEHVRNAKREAILSFKAQLAAKSPQPKTDTAAELTAKEDFATPAEDFTLAKALYAILVQRLAPLLRDADLPESTIAVLALMAFLKRRAREDEVAALEGAFGAFWNGSIHCDFFERWRPEDAAPISEGRGLFVVCFSSLGSGLVRPEWRGTLREVLSNIQATWFRENLLRVEVLHVMDPCVSWWQSNPNSGADLSLQKSWQGFDQAFGDFLVKQMRDFPNARTFVLGDSMGGTGALLLLKHLPETASALIFTPQTDVTNYGPCKRRDFSQKRKNRLREDIRTSVAACNARLRVHYGIHCDQDVEQVALLREAGLREIEAGASGSDEERSISQALVGHDYDDHVLSVHLKEQRCLGSIVQNEIETLLGRR